MPTSRVGQSTETGFTLIELMVVLVLIGLFLGLVVPRLPGVGEDRLQATGRHISGLVRHLYNEAALTGQEHRLRIDFATGRIGGRRLEADGELVDVDGSGRDGTLPASVRLLDVVLQGGRKSSSGRFEARILPIGWVDETVIHLAGDNGHMLTLYLQPLTGLTDFYDGYREF
jgi:general secretion pathway protein H